MINNLKLKRIAVILISVVTVVILGVSPLAYASLHERGESNIEEYARRNVILDENFSPVQPGWAANRNATLRNVQGVNYVHLWSFMDCNPFNCGAVTEFAVLQRQINLRPNTTYTIAVTLNGRATVQVGNGNLNTIVGSGHFNNSLSGFRDYEITFRTNSNTYQTNLTFILMADSFGNHNTGISQVRIIEH